MSHTQSLDENGTSKINNKGELLFFVQEAEKITRIHTIVISLFLVLES